MTLQEDPTLKRDADKAEAELRAAGFYYERSLAHFVAQYARERIHKRDRLDAIAFYLAWLVLYGMVLHLIVRDVP